MDLNTQMADVVFYNDSGVKLDAVQMVILVAMGYQTKEVDDVATELGLPGSQILAKFYEAYKKINNCINSILETAVAKEIGIDEKYADDVNADMSVKQSLQDELSKAAKVILVAMGYQMKEVDDVATELGLPGSQILAKFYEAYKKINNCINSILETAVAKEIGIDEKYADDVNADMSVKQSLQDELSKAAKELERKQRKELSKLMGEDLAQYRIKGDDVAWSQALASTKQKQMLSVKSGEKRLGEDSKEIDDLLDPQSKNKKKKKKHVRNQV